MKIAGAKETFRQIAAAYFGDAHVFFAGQWMAKLPEPYATIQFTSIVRPEHEIRHRRDDEFIAASRELTAYIDFNLYTKGRRIGTSNVYANTALDDMEGFLNFLESDYVQHRCVMENFSIEMHGYPTDYSELIRDESYQYRSYIELEMRFTDEVWGDYGQNDNELPTSSGGGNAEMVTDLHYFDTVEYGEEDIS